MTLFSATLLTALLLAVLGGLLLWNGSPVGALARGFPRSRRAAWIVMGGASAWFLFHVSQLSEADFGAYRVQLFLVFGLVAFLSFHYVREFLAVRGLCILVLLTSKLLLDAAYLLEGGPPGRLFLVSLAYAVIPFALYLALSPFRLRDFFNWLFANDFRPRITGVLVLAYGVILLTTAVTYP